MALVLEDEQQNQEDRLTCDVLYTTTFNIMEKTIRRLRFRWTIVEFVEDVCNDYGLGNQTIGLSLNLSDRSLAKRGFVLGGPRNYVTKILVERVLLACIVIGAKFAATRVCLSIKDLTKVYDNHSADEIKAEELQILHELGWKLHRPHVWTYLDPCAEAAVDVMMLHFPLIPVEDKYKAKLLSNVHRFASLSFKEFLTGEFRPSVVATSASIAGVAWFVATWGATRTSSSKEDKIQTPPGYHPLHSESVQDARFSAVAAVTPPPAKRKKANGGDDKEQPFTPSSDPSDPSDPWNPWNPWDPSGPSGGRCISNTLFRNLNHFEDCAKLVYCACTSTKVPVQQELHVVQAMIACTNRLMEAALRNWEFPEFASA